MTDKKVINLAQKLITEFKCESDTMVDFCNTVIKKFEQQPSDDCITKAEVINTIHKTIYGFFDIADDDSEEPINDKDKLLLTINKAISNAVKALPSVASQRPRGKWIKAETEGRFYCSICGGIHNDTESGEWREVFDFKYPYCPNCGADMRESEE